MYTRVSPKILQILIANLTLYKVVSQTAQQNTLTSQFGRILNFFCLSISVSLIGIQALLFGIESWKSVLQETSIRRADGNSGLLWTDTIKSLKRQL